MLLCSRASETCLLPLKVRALNAHAPNVGFSGAWTRSRKPSIETIGIDLKSWYPVTSAHFKHRLKPTRPTTNSAHANSAHNLTNLTHSVTNSTHHLSNSAHINISIILYDWWRVVTFKQLYIISHCQRSAFKENRWRINQ